jgi:enterochelin esterase-like enzyme
MKKFKLTIAWCFLLSLAALPLAAQISKVSEVLTLKSKILNMDRKFAIYLPPGYETSQRSYPVLYLLHGGGDDHTGWVQFGEVQHITDKAIAEGKATEMIIVMPDANTTRRGYFNSIKGDWRYEDFFFQELMPYVEKTYRIKSEKRYRAISGLSMGGGGTLMYTLHHPELFSAACPLSASTGPLTVEDLRKTLARESPMPADTAINSYFNRHSSIALVNNMPDTLKKSVRWYLDIGDDDFLFEGNFLLHIAMRKKEIPHEFRTRDGAHNWTYWREALPEVLHFVSMSFSQF